MAQADRLEVAGPQIVRVATKRFFDMGQGGSPGAAPGVDLGGGEVAGGGPGRVPGRLVESVVGLPVASEQPQRHAEIVERLAIVRIGVATTQALEGEAEGTLGQIEFAAPEAPQANRVVAAAVERIAAQRLEPVEFRRSGGVPILAQVQAGDEQLVGAGDILRVGGLGGGFGGIVSLSGLGPDVDQPPTVPGDDAQPKRVASGFSRRRHLEEQRPFGREIDNSAVRAYARRPPR